MVPVAAGGAAAETAAPTGGSGIIADAGQATAARHAKESASPGPKATFSGLATFTARITEDTDATGSVDADRTSDPTGAITSETAAAAHPAGADGEVSACRADRSRDAAATDDPAHTSQAKDAAAADDSEHTGQAGESKDTEAASTAGDSAHTGQSKGTAADLADDSARTGEAGGPGDAEDAELALDAEPDMDDPTSDEAHPGGGAEPGDGAAAWVPARDEPAAGPPPSPGATAPNQSAAKPASAGPRPSRSSRCQHPCQRLRRISTGCEVPRHHLGKSLSRRHDAAHRRHGRDRV